MNSICGKDIDINYNNNKIIDNLSIEIPKGKISIIIGPNGCGKSTLLKGLGRIKKIKKGDIFLEDLDLKKISSKEIAKKLAILPQSPQGPEGLTVYDLVSYGRFPHRNKRGKINDEDKKVIDWALKVTKLEEYQLRPIENMSGGQRQRVWIAMALAQQTDIIFLDEPTTYLDLSYQLELLELLEELNIKHQTTIVMVLHDLNLASRFAHYMVAMKDGKIVKEGCPHTIMNKEVLKEAFNIEANIEICKQSKKPICISYNLIKN